LQAALVANPVAAIRSGFAVVALLAETGGIWLEHDVMVGEGVARWTATLARRGGFFAFAPSATVSQTAPSASAVSTMLVAATTTSNLVRTWFSEAEQNPSTTLGLAFRIASAAAACVVPFLAMSCYIIV
jgi:hypothetical protein